MQRGNNGFRNVGLRGKKRSRSRSLLNGRASPQPAEMKLTGSAGALATCEGVIRSDPTVPSRPAPDKRNTLLRLMETAWNTGGIVLASNLLLVS